MTRDPEMEWHPGTKMVPVFPQGAGTGHDPFKEEEGRRCHLTLGSSQSSPHCPAPLCHLQASSFRVHSGRARAPTHPDPGLRVEAEPCLPHSRESLLLYHCPSVAVPPPVLGARMGQGTVPEEQPDLPAPPRPLPCPAVLTWGFWEPSRPVAPSCLQRSPTQELVSLGYSLLRTLSKGDSDRTGNYLKINFVHV